MAGQRRPRLIAMPESRIAAAERAFPGIYEPEAAAVVFAIRALAQRLEDRANAWLRPFGVNAAQHNYLTVLYFSPEGLTLRELSTLVHTSNSAVTPMVASLEKHGLLRRRVNPRDRRSVVVELTAKGRRLIGKSFPVHHRNIASGMVELTRDERRTLGRLLLKVGAGFEPDGSAKA